MKSIPSTRRFYSAHLSAASFDIPAYKPEIKTFNFRNATPNRQAGTEFQAVPPQTRTNFAAQKMISFNPALKEAIFDYYKDAEKLQGVPCLSLPGFNSIVKGLRLGEFSVLTGPTGCGKTSVLSQLSLDFCQQGVPTLWGSFEIPVHRLLAKMLRQFAHKDLSIPEILSSEYESIAQQFSLLPMHFMDFYGSVQLERVLQVMDYGVKHHGIQHIILDNLQFMLSGQERSNSDKYELLDKSVAALRNFASKNPVHITLVIHPRKEDDNCQLGISSVLGTSKATQEADNVIILQKIHTTRYLDIKKNRFDGELGKIYLGYDNASLRVNQIEKPAEKPSEKEVGRKLKRVSH